MIISKALLIFIVIIKLVQSKEGNLNKLSFPENFLFGVASSAYQIEGGHNVNGKGESIWDYHTKKNPKFVIDSSNGNKACDSYNNYKEDVQLVKNLGVQFYRFSISWSRILPTGFSNKINPDGIEYYNNLINELIANGIIPMVTMYHYDIPQSLQELGGWANPFMAYYFEDYAYILYSNFGDRVKYWITFNSACVGYGDKQFPPFVNKPAIADYMCGYVTLLAHAKAYHLYDTQFRSSQQGRVGITMDAKWYEAGTNSTEDLEAAERAKEFYFGRYINPICHPDGNYPEVVQRRINALSRSEGFLKSRLPELLPQEVEYVQGTFDFLGLNIYTTFLIRNIPDVQSKEPSFRKDGRFEPYQDTSLPLAKSKWLRVAPDSIRNMLNWVKTKYDDPEIFITESGFSDNGEIEDTGRINFYQQYLGSLLDAIHKDNVTVKGFSAWSLMDNFEWTQGYSEKFGLYHVDFKDPKRKRTAKNSAIWYRSVIENRKIMPVIRKTKEKRTSD